MLFYSLEMVLNSVLGLGQRVDVASLVGQAGMAPSGLLLGMIWGLWHAPVIAMGYKFPGCPALGIVLMAFYSVLLAYVLGYVMLKTGNVLLAAFLHQLNNGFGAYLTTFWYRPDDVAFSLSAGALYGLPLLLLVVLLILGDPVWRREDQ